MSSYHIDPRPNDPPRPQRKVANKLLPLSLGLTLCFLGVLIAWLLRHRVSMQWRNGGAAAAWIGCLLSPVFWTLLIVVGTMLVALIWWPIGELMTLFGG